jgi:hypothetical protein
MVLVAACSTPATPTTAVTATEPSAPTPSTAPTTTTTRTPTTTAAQPGIAFDRAQMFGTFETAQVGLGDLDGDGDLDAVFANMAVPSTVWRNDGTGQLFETDQILTEQGHGVALGDLDGDHDIDAVISTVRYADNQPLPSRVYLNDGSGALVDTGQDLGDTAGSGVTATLFDADGDADLDLYIAYYERAGTPDTLYLNDGTGHFTDSGVAIDEDEVDWGDIDGDGDVDLFAKVYGVGYVARRNDGAGHFDEAWRVDDPAAMEGDVALGDFDGDGDADALVANGIGASSERATMLLLNDGTGVFADSGQVLNPTHLAAFAVGDLDGDGTLDVYVANSDVADEVWLNDGSLFDSGLRLAGAVAGSLSTRPTLGDLDGDGDLDVVVGAFAGRAEIWINQG